MRYLFLSLAILAGFALNAQCGCGQQVPKQPKTLVAPETRGQTIDKHKKLDYVLESGGVQMRQEKKFDYIDTGGGRQTVDYGITSDYNLDPGGMKVPNDGAKKFDFYKTGCCEAQIPASGGYKHNALAFDADEVKLPSEVKKYDVIINFRPIPTGGGKKYNLTS